MGTTPGKVPPSAPAEYEDIPLTSMRRTIGKRLLESTQQLPHFYATAEINMGEYRISATRYPKYIEEWKSGMEKGEADV